MSIEKVSVQIKGISPLLMHAYPLNPIEAIDKKPIEEQAEYSAYRDPEDGLLFIPGVNIQRCLIAAAVYQKGKNRASLQKVVAACVLIDPERCSLGVKDYEIDVRGVVVPATKGRILRYRPRLDNWSVEFDVTFDSDLLTESQMRRVIDDAGSRVGLLDFRPERKGPFGRFIVTEWKK